MNLSMLMPNYESIMDEFCGSNNNQQSIFMDEIGEDNTSSERIIHHLQNEDMMIISTSTNQLVEHENPNRNEIKLEGQVEMIMEDGREVIATSHSAATLNFPERKPNDGNSVEAEESELLREQVKSEQEAYDLYNDYAFKKGFGIRKNKNVYKYGTRIIRKKHFCCANEGEKDKKGSRNKCYSKVDTRTGCQARIVFDIDDNGVWTVSEHKTLHNHPFCSPTKRHKLRSHRKVMDEHIRMIKELKKRGVSTANAIRAMTEEAGGSPLIGFTARDAYNGLAKENRKELDGSSSNAITEDGSCDTDETSSSIWRLRMIRKFTALIIACEGNNEARKIIEEGYMKLKEEIEKTVGPINDETEGSSY